MQFIPESYYIVVFIVKFHITYMSNNKIVIVFNVKRIVKKSGVLCKKC